MINLHRFGNPNQFMKLSAIVLPWAGTLTCILFPVGLYLALFLSPPDYEQRETVRIMYVHVPAAWMALLSYTLMAAFSAAALIWRYPLANVVARSAAPIGAIFTLICLVTGALWGQPTWGTWWVWDAQLTLVVVMFLIFLSYMMLKNYSEESIQSARFRAVLAIIGFINVPLIHYAVQIWRTHHPTVLREGGGGLSPDMRSALYTCTLVWLCLFIAIYSRRVSLERAREELVYLQAEVRDRKAILGQMAE